MNLGTTYEVKKGSKIAIKNTKRYGAVFGDENIVVGDHSGWC